MRQHGKTLLMLILATACGDSDPCEDLVAGSELPNCEQAIAVCFDEATDASWPTCFDEVEWAGGCPQQTDSQEGLLWAGNTQGFPAQGAPLLRIDTQDAWDAFLADWSQDNTGLPTLPDVDFSVQEVIGVTEYIAGTGGAQIDTHGWVDVGGVRNLNLTVHDSTGACADRPDVSLASLVLYTVALGAVTELAACVLRINTCEP